MLYWGFENEAAKCNNFLPFGPGNSNRFRSKRSIQILDLILDVLCDDYIWLLNGRSIYGEILVWERIREERLHCLWRHLINILFKRKSDFNNNCYFQYSGKIKENPLQKNLIMFQMKTGNDAAVQNEIRNYLVLKHSKVWPNLI